MAIEGGDLILFKFTTASLGAPLVVSVCTIHSFIEGDTETMPARVLVEKKALRPSG